MEASEAGSRSGDDQASHYRRGDAARIHPWHVLLHAGIIQQVTRFEIIETVQHEIDVFQQVDNIVSADIGNYGFNLSFGIDRRELSGGGSSFSIVSFTRFQYGLSLIRWP